MAYPVIASLNGVSLGGWLRYAKQMEQAGADALELNIYDMPTDPELPGAEVEQRYVRHRQRSGQQLKIPLAVKIGPYFSSMANMARETRRRGRRRPGDVQPVLPAGLRPGGVEVVPNLMLSRPQELLLRLHWAAVLFGNIRSDMAITGGVHSAEDIVKSMMAGARVAMMTSAILENGIGHVKQLVFELKHWLEEHEYQSIHQMRGSMSSRKVSDPTAFERANYMRVLGSYTLAAAK